MTFSWWTPLKIDKDFKYSLIISLSFCDNVFVSLVWETESKAISYCIDYFSWLIAKKRKQ